MKNTDNTLNASVDATESVKNGKDIVKVAIRTVVEWILRGGDIDTRSSVGAYEAQRAMRLGANAHRKIQKSKLGDYKSEVWFSREFELDEFTISLGGRADGVFSEDTNVGSVGRDALGTPFGNDGKLVIIDEIKSTLAPLDSFGGEYNNANIVNAHWGQAMCYAYIHATEQQLSHIGVQLTYFQLETEEFRTYRKIFTLAELEIFMNDLIERYAIWVKFERDWRIERNASIEELKFPFETYRPGQRELAAAAYRAIIAERNLFADAPTGIGKTISTIFPAIKAMPGSNLTKIFYLTAKTITRGVAYDAIYLMQQRGLKFKTVAVTAKDKICPNAHDENRICSPDYCERANGHYNRANDAVLDALKNNHAITRDVIEEYSTRHCVCPFEFSLDLSMFADAVICDYNYVFDPVVYLRRFFQNNYDKNYAFLIDEAHNLVDRAREMYSAELKKSQFTDIKQAIKRFEEAQRNRRNDRPRSSVDSKPPAAVESNIANVIDIDNEGRPHRVAPTIGVLPLLPLKTLKKSVNTIDKYLSEHRKKCLALKGKEYFTIQEYDAVFADLVLEFTQECNQFLEAWHNAVIGMNDIDETMLNLRSAVLKAYFEARFYQLISGFYDERYVTLVTAENRDLTFKLFCLDPSLLISEALKRAKSSVIFSATLSPIEYFKEAIIGNNTQVNEANEAVEDKDNTDDTENNENKKEEITEEVRAIRLRSPFKQTNLTLVVGANINTRYKEREKSYEQIADYIEVIVQRGGNYIAFFPSYEYMRNVYEEFCVKYPQIPIIIQTSDMRETERENFLEKFAVFDDGDIVGDVHRGVPPLPTATRPILVGFCVLGGVFSEGIDLTGDRLNGAIITGVGLPRLSAERDIIKQYFDDKNGMGYEYSYMYPGMNKVLQAAGRVIRTASDTGIVLLLDERFNYTGYKQLFPEHWNHFRVVRSPKQLQSLLS